MNDRSVQEPDPEQTLSYAGRPRDAQLEYKAILANAWIGIAFTRDRRFTLCNPKFAEMLGWKPEELIGQSGEVVYPSRESYEAMGAIAVPILSAGNQLDVEWELRRKDGSTFLCRTIAKALSATDPQRGTVWIVEDITERKRNVDDAARLLREQDAILNTAPIGICFVRDRRIVRCTRRFEQMHGYGPGELEGQSTAILYADEASYRAIGEDYERLSGGESFSAETLTRRKDGSTYWSRITGRGVDPADPALGSVWMDEDITERKRAGEELRRVLAEQQALANNVVVGITFVRDRKTLRCNRRYEEMFGYEPGEALGLPTRRFYFTEEDYLSVQRAYADIDAGRTSTTEHWLRRKDGSGFWCRMSGHALEAGKPESGYVWMFEDITERKRADQQVRRLAEEQRLILDNATVGIAFLRQRVFQRCNARLEEMFGYDKGEMLGKSTSMLFLSSEDFESEGALMYQQLAVSGGYQGERQVKRKDGSQFWCRVVAKAVDPAHPEEGSIAIYDDITADRATRESLEASRADLERAVAKRTAELEAEIADRRQAESRAQHLADHDVLTGLPNRRLLEDRLTQALALSQRNREQTAVMFVDLDRFKAINDQLGHSAGDAVLKEVAERLAKLLREVDTICRIGGDEFVVVLPEIKRSSDAAHIAAKILEMVSQPFHVGERELNITPSVGISVFPDDGRDAETLIRNADAAMYHAKGTGRANYQFFTEQMNQAASRRLVIENDLRRAVDAGDLRVYFQPVVEAVSGRLASHEALLRWQHPQRGVLGPAEFIQVAEDTGLVLPLGEWVLGEACRWGMSEAGAGLPVSVNLSARQFNDPRLLDLVARMLKESGLPPQRLELEVAEAVAMQQPDVALATMKKLRELGVQLALDDFGIGLSGVAHLSRVPVDRVKIDRSLIAESAGGEERHPVVPAIVGLGHALGLKVVGKGVETEAQKKMLIACGCDYLQGFLTGAPAEASSPKLL
jgi:diguanylate cyclase (GGDEF)-like protein/PAS domain S-box-containing protein